MKVDYDEMARTNAQRHAGFVTNDNSTLCTRTGLPLVTQAHAAKMIGVTARGLRDIGNLPRYSVGRGHPTYYSRDTIEVLRGFRKQGEGCRGSSLQSVLLGETANADVDEIDHIWMGLYPDIKALRVAIELLELPEPDGAPPAYLDADGAIKARLLLSELQQVLKDHCGTSGVNGEHRERDDFDLDATPKPITAETIAGLIAEKKAQRVEQHRKQKEAKNV